MDANAITDPKSIQAQLHRILSSPEFKATVRQKNFLRFIVERFLQGRADEIKGYTIATDVFGRKPDFDPKTDPIVSIEAKRLRRALEHYYLIAGQLDPLRIHIPKGNYVPTFHYQDSREATCSSTDTKPVKDANTGAWPSVLIRPFRNLSDDASPSFIAEGCMTELAIELSRYQDIRVLMKPPGGRGQTVEEPSARFSIEGSIRYGAQEISVAVQLFDQKAHRQIWGDVYRCNLKTDELVAFQTEIAQIIAARIGQERGYISQTLALESLHKPPAEMATYEALLKFYKHDATFTVETFEDALAALEQAAIREPEFSQVWSLLGRLYCENYALETTDRDTPIQKAIEFAGKGVRLDPSCQRARVVLAMAHLLNDKLAEGLTEARNALALNPHSLIFMDVIGYVLALLGDWDEGAAIIRKAIALNPYHRPYIYHVLFLDRLRKAEFEKAYMETLNFRAPALFFDPLLQASALGHMERSDEGAKFVRMLLSLKPDFQARGRVLIRRWVKSDALFDRVAYGLRKSGLAID